LISTGLGLLGPILLGRIIDIYVIPRNPDSLTRAALWMLAVYLGNGAAAIVQGLVMGDLGQHLVNDIRSQLFAHIQSLSMAYHDRHRTADLMRRVANDTDAINSALTNCLTDFVSNILLMGGTLVAMFFLNWQLAIGTLIVIPIMLYITGQVTRYSRRAFRQVQRN